MANGLIAGGGLNSFGFLGLLYSLLNFNVSVLTEGGVAPVVGIMTNISQDFITLCSGTAVNYVPISQITIIARAEGVL